MRSLPFPRAELPAAAGVGRITFARQGHRTRVERAYATSPLKLLRPRNAGSGAWVYTSTYGGGFVDGDAIDLEIEARAGSMGFLSTQSSTKIYRSGSGTWSRMHATIAEDALLVVFPDPVVPFDGSRFAQRQAFTLASSGNVIVVDWLSAGRVSRGERWAFSRYSSALAITRDGRRIVHDVLSLDVADGSVGERLGRFDVVAVAAVVGPAVEGHAREIVDACQERPVLAHSRLLAAAAPVSRGCVLKIAGPSVEEVGRTLRRFLEFVPGVLGDDPWGRKY